LRNNNICNSRRRERQQSIDVKSGIDPPLEFGKKKIKNEENKKYY
jgi:hypothetical protein